MHAVVVNVAVRSNRHISHCKTSTVFFSLSAYPNPPAHSEIWRGTVFLYFCLNVFIGIPLKQDGVSDGSAAGRRGGRGFGRPRPRLPGRWTDAIGTPVEYIVSRTNNHRVGTLTLRELDLVSSPCRCYTVYLISAH